MKTKSKEATVDSWPATEWTCMACGKVVRKGDMDCFRCRLMKKKQIQRRGMNKS